MTFKQGFSEFRQLMSYLKPHRKMYYTGLLGNSISNASVSILLSFVIHYLLNFVVNRDENELYQAIYLVCGTFLVLSILSPLCSYAYQRCVRVTIANIRLTLFRHMVNLPYEVVGKRHSGDLVSRLTNDVQALEQTYTDQVRTIALQIFMFIGSVTILFVLDWRFAVMTLGLGIVSAWLNTRFAAKMRETSETLQLHTSIFTERLSDLLSGLQAVKLFGLHGKVGRLCNEASGEVSKIGIRQGRRIGIQDMFNFLIEFITLGGVLVVGLILVSRQQMELGALGQIVQLQGGISMVFLQLGAAVSMMQNSFAGLGRIKQIMDEKVEPEYFPGATIASHHASGATSGVSAAIEFCDVSFEYESDRAILHQLSLTVEEGQVTALVGPSGGGKSTIMKLLLGLYSPKSGEIKVRGKRASEYKLEDIRNLISYVPQEATLFHGSVADNIRFGSLAATDEEVQAAAQAAYAHLFISELSEGYDTIVGERGANLSGGQRQRIAIARALLKNAPFLLLDEATSALDTESEHEVQQGLTKLMKGRTTLIIAHRFTTIAQADVICVVAEGEVKEQGTHEELLSIGGIYTELYRLQFHAEPNEQTA